MVQLGLVKLSAKKKVSLPLTSFWPEDGSHVEVYIESSLSHEAILRSPLSLCLLRSVLLKTDDKQLKNEGRKSLWAVL